MGGIKIYFFDTYALIEIFKGNKSYEKYKKEKFIITILNLIELHYFMLKNNGEDFAREIMIDYSKFIIPVTLKIIEEANIFRLKHKKKDISTTDAIGYVLSLRNNIKFLTGDIKFENMDDVEFVK